MTLIARSYSQRVPLLQGLAAFSQVEAGVANGTFTVTNTHTYSSAGTFKITVTVTDTTISQTATSTGTATLTMQRLTVTGINPKSSFTAALLNTKNNS